MDINVVVVDDDPIILDEARRFLSAENMRVTCLNSGTLFLKYIEKNTPDLVLLDILMPEPDGFDTYIALRRYDDKMGLAHTAVIFISGDKITDTEEMGLVLGASDVILKPFRQDILIRRIKNAIKNTRRIEDLTEEATIDMLTGFFNKAKGVERVSKLCKRKKGALLIMDLDSFKLVNDLFGHKMGDSVLKAFAKVAGSNSRATDTICRIGGDEFLAFFEDVTEESALEAISGRINSQLVSEANRLMGEDNGIPLGVSIGAVMVPEYGTDYDTLFSLADSALYKVKQNGKHGCRVYKDGDESDENSSEDRQFILDRIVKTLGERNDKEGSLFVGNESLTAIFRFLMRYDRRFGERAGAILFELEAPDDSEGEALKNAAGELEEILAKELMISDVVLPYTGRSFFVLLSRCDEKELTEKAEKIIETYNARKTSSQTRLTYVFKML